MHITHGFGALQILTPYRYVEKPDIRSQSLLFPANGFLFFPTCLFILLHRNDKMGRHDTRHSTSERKARRGPPWFLFLEKKLWQFSPFWRWHAGQRRNSTDSRLNNNHFKLFRHFLILFSLFIQPLVIPSESWLANSSLPAPTSTQCGSAAVGRGMYTYYHDGGTCEVGTFDLSVPGTSGDTKTVMLRG